MQQRDTGDESIQGWADAVESNSPKVDEPIARSYRDQALRPWAGPDLVDDDVLRPMTGDGPIGTHRHATSAPMQARSRRYDID